MSFHSRTYCFSLFFFVVLAIPSVFGSLPSAQRVENLPVFANNIKTPNQAGCLLARRRRRRKKLTHPIDLNTATAEQLENLPRISSKQARQIVALRKQLDGSFQSVQQLRSIRGIGKKTVARICPHVTIGRKKPNCSSQKWRKKRKRRRYKRKKRKRRKRKKRRHRRRRRHKRKKRSRRSWKGSWKSRRKSRYAYDSRLDGDTSLRDRPEDRRTYSANFASGNSTNWKQKQRQRQIKRDYVKQPYRRMYRRQRPNNDRKHKSHRRQKRRNCYQRWFGKYGRSFPPLNINTATAKRIQTLPCIGKKRAVAIVSMRMARGAFKCKDDLRQIAGIGRKIMGWIRPHIRLKLNINRATLAELEALHLLSGGLGEAIYHYRKRKGKFRRLRDLMHVRGIGRGTFERIKFFLTLKEPKKQMILLIQPRIHRGSLHRKSYQPTKPLPKSQDYIPERTHPKPRSAPQNKVIKID